MALAEHSTGERGETPPRDWEKATPGITFGCHDGRYLEITNVHQNSSGLRRRPPAINRVFTTLAHLIDEDFLREASRHTRKASAPGIDGVTAQSYAEHLEENLHDVHERLPSGR